MFTGLIETMGVVREVRGEGAGRALTIEERTLAPQLPLGASVAINGCCLTVVRADAATFSFQVGPETLRCTSLGELQPGEHVNLERAMALGDRLGGHLVQGHIDGMGRILRREPQGDWEMFWFECPAELTRTMVPKGSIAVDGISLTLVDVTSTRFSVALIPHTLAVTTLGRKQPPHVVNLETDLIGKYVHKLLAQSEPRP